MPLARSVLEEQDAPSWKPVRHPVAGYDLVLALELAEDLPARRGMPVTRPPHGGAQEAESCGGHEWREIERWCGWRKVGWGEDNLNLVKMRVTAGVGIESRVFHLRVLVDPLHE